MSTALNAMTLDGATGKYHFKWQPEIDTDRAPCLIVTNEADFDGTYKDPVIAFGYNYAVGGVEEVTNEGYGAWKFEGHYLSGGSKPAVGLTLSAATVGTGRTVTADGAVFAGTSADVGKSIVYQSGVATITGFTSTTVCTAKIVSAFPSVTVPTGVWYFDTLPVIEMYLEAFRGGNAGVIRPFFTWFRKDTGVIQGMGFAVGKDKLIEFGHRDTDAESDSATHRFGALTYSIRASTNITAGQTTFNMESYANQTSAIKMSAHGDVIATGPTIKFEVSAVGGSGQHRVAAYSIRSNGSSTAKTGVLALRGDDTAGVDSVMVSIGNSSSLSSALFAIDAANMPVNYTTMRITAKASQTSRLFAIDGLNNDGTTAESTKVGIYPKGYWTVRESGNTTTDRAPGTGASTATFTATNKPGASTAVAPTMWFPMLSTSGALFWVPGWAD